MSASGGILRDRGEALLHQSAMREDSRTCLLDADPSFGWPTARRLDLAVLLGLGVAACSATPDPVASDDGSAAGGGGALTGTGGMGPAGGTGGAGVGAVGGTGGNLSTDPDAGAGATGGGEECGRASADAVLETEPVDIILIVDNSGSMDEELMSVEANINQNFATILESSGVDYRLIAISRHRDDDNTSLCVSAPLSTLTSCPAEAPGISERFYHFDTKIESDDSFDRILDTYMAPFGGACQSTCDNGETSEDDGDDNSGSTALGWHEWLRPGAKKVFLEMSDDTEDMPAGTFVQLLTEMAPEFGTPDAPSFIFHSIVGLAGKPVASEAYLPSEPIQTEVCPDVTTAGQIYQELSIMTGGLRFPICEFANYDVVFNRIAEDVIVRAQLACDFAIPATPDGRTLERDKIAVSYSSGDTLVADFGQVLDPAACLPNAFYIEGDRVVLCPEACEAVSMDVQASVDVLFTCESTIIIVE